LVDDRLLSHLIAFVGQRARQVHSCTSQDASSTLLNRAQTPEGPIRYSPERRTPRWIQERTNIPKQRGISGADARFRCAPKAIPAYAQSRPRTPCPILYIPVHGPPNPSVQVPYTPNANKTKSGEATRYNPPSTSWILSATLWPSSVARFAAPFEDDVVALSFRLTTSSIFASRICFPSCLLFFCSSFLFFICAISAVAIYHQY
jgi:hypothetical protein